MLRWERTGVRRDGLGSPLGSSEREAGQVPEGLGGAATRGWAGLARRGGRVGPLGRAATPRSGTVLKVNSSAPEGMTGSGVLPSPPKNVCLLLHTLGGSGPRTLFCAFWLEVNTCA